jgi:hypothetical protein
MRLCCDPRSPPDIAEADETVEFDSRRASRDRRTVPFARWARSAGYAGAASPGYAIASVSPATVKPRSQRRELALRNRAAMIPEKVGSGIPDLRETRSCDSDKVAPIILYILR